MRVQTSMLSRSGALSAFAAGALFVASAGVALAQQPVQWMNVVNAMARGNSVQKAGGCDGCDDAGAVSRQIIRGGDGYVEFVVDDPYSFWMAGLGHAEGNPRFNSIDYGLRFNGNGTADVMENGRYMPGSDIDYAAGDTFRIAIVRGRVEYLRNGRVTFESRRAPQYPLVLVTALGSSGSTIRNARIETGGRAVADGDYRYRNRNTYPDRYPNADRNSISDQLLRLDRNRDGVVSRSEWLGSRRSFDQLDSNGDGVLSARELAATEFGVRATSGQLVTVNPAEQWNDTGIWVEAGDVMNFDAEGRVQLSNNGADFATPSGAESGRRADNAPFRSAPAGSLIGRIGNSAPFMIGSRRTVRAPESGQLYLGVNDDYMQDNRGSYRVTVDISPR
jgi:hypothetical protein